MKTEAPASLVAACIAREVAAIDAAATIPLHPALHPAPRMPRLFLCAYTTEPDHSARVWPVDPNWVTPVQVFQAYAMADTELAAAAALRQELFPLLPQAPADRFRAGTVREVLVQTAANFDEAAQRFTHRPTVALGAMLKPRNETPEQWRAFCEVSLNPQTDDQGVTHPARFRLFKPSCTPARNLEPQYCYQLRGKRCAIDPVRDYGYWERADGSEGGGLWFDRKPGGALELRDYDGAHNLPAAVTAELRAWGVLVPPEFDVTVD